MGLSYYLGLSSHYIGGMMTRNLVVDSNGNLISGIKRNNSGGLSVDDPSGYTKYVHEKHKDTEIVRLTNEVFLLKEQMKMILEKLNG